MRQNLVCEGVFGQIARSDCRDGGCAIDVRCYQALAAEREDHVGG